MNINKNDSNFIEDIINGMYDWVRVIDRDDNIIYMNKAMSEDLGCESEGEKKCYAVIGRNTPCENCVSRKAVFDGTPHEKEEIINGRTLSIMSSPIKDKQGNITSVVEVLRDITQTKELQKKIIEQNNKLQDDLNIARKLQCSLLPKTLSEDKIKFSFIYQPCESIGGDFVDIYNIDEKHIGVYIADVSGHGVYASMLTVFLRSSINKGILSPSEALKKLYKEYNKSNFDPDLYITVFYAVINLEERTITFSNAGHNVAPIIFNKSKFNLLRTPGIPISNWLDKPGYTEKTLPLEKGDRIFLYTDGIIEIRNSLSEIFGEERLLNLLLNGGSEPNSILNGIFDSALTFSGIKDVTEISDDITMALLEIK